MGIWCVHRQPIPGVSVNAIGYASPRHSQIWTVVPRRLCRVVDPDIASGIQSVRYRYSSTKSNAQVTRPSALTDAAILHDRGIFLHLVDEIADYG